MFLTPTICFFLEIAISRVCVQRLCYSSDHHHNLLNCYDNKANEKVIKNGASGTYFGAGRSYIVNYMLSQTD